MEAAVDLIGLLIRGIGGGIIRRGVGKTVRRRICRGLARRGLVARVHGEQIVQIHPVVGGLTIPTVGHAGFRLHGGNIAAGLLLGLADGAAADRKVLFRRGFKRSVVFKFLVRILRGRVAVIVDAGRRVQGIVGEFLIPVVEIAAARFLCGGALLHKAEEPAGGFLRRGAFPPSERLGRFRRLLLLLIVVQRQVIVQIDVRLEEGVPLGVRDRRFGIDIRGAGGASRIARRGILRRFLRLSTQIESVHDVDGRLEPGGIKFIFRQNVVDREIAAVRGAFQRIPVVIVHLDYLPFPG